MAQSNDTHFGQYLTHGWCVFDHDEELENWVRRTLPSARAEVASAENRQWFRHDGTWFAGVNVLKNSPDGSVDGGVPLSGAATNYLTGKLGVLPDSFENGQVSVCYPGYPKMSEDESETAFRYRLRRDAAHVDGLHREGPDRRRFLREHHQYILGIAMSTCSDGASPLVMWNGSHHLVRQALTETYAGTSPAQWHAVDVTDSYQNVRRGIFEQCERVEVPLRPGQAIVAHRLVLHGTAPWQENATCDSDGRMICFFRPNTLSAEQWLSPD